VLNVPAVQTVILEARSCAMAMQESGTYIRSELPNVRMAADLVAQAKSLCDDLIGTSFDVIPELLELDDLLAYGGSEEDIESAIELFMRWLSDDIRKMGELVMKLRAAAEHDPECEGSYILVAECALNVLEPFNRARAAADSIRRT